MCVCVCVCVYKGVSYNQRNQAIGALIPNGGYVTTPSTVAIPIHL